MASLTHLTKTDALTSPNEAIANHFDTQSHRISHRTPKTLRARASAEWLEIFAV
ncbi:hypothetical protein [Aliiruegeria lutimaris]|uniref:hypothetical protein n=1 Tax=Aliiruegeria lutimaris TaxID=571298 RepID=UPI00147B19A2|nr:hypothetical protein [Aliiruegeria lutimaris]